MNYNLEINNRPFRAIKAGTKRIEGRVTTSYDDTPYNKMRLGDTIKFTNKTTKETLVAKVIGVRHYLDTRTMLKKEGVENVLSSGKNLEDGIESYSNYLEYKENIPYFGIYAIEIGQLL